MCPINNDSTHSQPITAPPPESGEALDRSLDRSLVVGIAWTGAIKWGTQIVSWVSTILIARLLTPGDFGIMGMATVYTGLVLLVNEFGLTSAILQRRDLTSSQMEQLGGFGLCIGVFFTLVSVLMAAPVAEFYGDAAVRTVIMLLSVNFTVNAIGVLPRALLARDLRFDRLALIDGTVSLVQVATTLLLAVLGYRYFSLVFGSLIGTSLGVILALWWRRHRVAFPRDFGSIRQTVAVGWHVVVQRIAWYVYQNADFAIVGRVFGKGILGAYSVGWQLASVPVERVSSLVGQVTPGIFSRVQDDMPALRRYFLGIVGGIAFITFPAAAGIAIIAELLVPLVLGDHWLQAILPLQLLAAYAGIRSIDTVTSQVLLFTGHSRQTMWYMVIAACIFPVLFLIATRWGVAGVAATWVVAYPFVISPMYRLLFRVLDLRIRDYLVNLWPAASSTVIMAIGLWLLRPVLLSIFPMAIALVAEILCGIVIYAAMIWFFHRERLDMLRRVAKMVRE